MQKELSAFVINELSEDFGLDFQATLTEELDSEYQQVSSINFFIQLKASQNFGDGDTAKFSASTDDLNLYLQNPSPVVLALYDNSQDEFYWTIVQEYIWDELEERTPNWRSQGSNTVRVDKDQTFSDTDHLRSRVLEGQNRILRRHNMAMGIGQGLKFSPDDPSELDMQVESSLQDFKGHSLIKSAEMLKKGKREGAKEQLRKVYEAPEQDEGKLKALSGLLHIHHPDQGQEEALQILELAEEGMDLAQNLDQLGHEKYIQIHKNHAQLSILLDKTEEILFSMKIQEDGGDGLFQVFLTEGLFEMLGEKLRVFGEINEALNTLLENDEYYHYTISLPLIVDYITTQVIVYAGLKIVDRDELRNSDQVHPIVAQLEQILEIMDEPETEMSIHRHLGLYYYHIYKQEEAIEHFEAAVQLAEKVGDEFMAEGVSDFLEEVRENPDPYAPEEDKTDPMELPLSEFQDLMKEVAEAQGFDLDNPSDDIGESVKMAVKDVDITEYLRHCEHLRIRQMFTSPLGHQMGLRSLGPKLMWCKHGGGSEGHNLEMQFRHFKQTHCEGCEHHSPRGDSWTCTMEDVQEQEQDPELQEVVENIRENRP